MDDLRRLLAHFEGGRVMATAQAPSPFYAAVKDAQLPAGARLSKVQVVGSNFQGKCSAMVSEAWPGEITSWEQMKNLFLTKFQAAVKYAPPVTSLANIKKKEGKSLNSYLKRNGLLEASSRKRSNDFGGLVCSGGIFQTCGTIVGGQQEDIFFT